MLTIIRKSDNQPCGTIPSNMTVDQEILFNVLPNFGGSAEDYEVMEMEAPPPSLSEIQQQKIIELNTACNQDILNGFSSSCTGVEHQYNFDLEYQANMNQRATMFLLKPTMVETWWPTKDKGVITHSREQFVQLCEDAERIKGEKIFRYFEMKAQILAPTTTAEQVEAFAW